MYKANSFKNNNEKSANKSFPVMTQLVLSYPHMQSAECSTFLVPTVCWAQCN